MKVSPDWRTSPLCHFICGSTSSQNSSCILAVIPFLSLSPSLCLSLSLFLPPLHPHSSLPPSSLSHSPLSLFYPSGWGSGVHLPLRPAADQRGVEPAAEAGSRGAAPRLGGRIRGSAFLHHAGAGQEATSGCCRLVRPMRHRQLLLTPHVKVYIFMTQQQQQQQQQCGWIKGMSRMSWAHDPHAIYA